MLSDLKYVKEDIEREVSYTLHDYKLGVISSDKVEDLIHELTQLKELIDDEIAKLTEALGSRSTSTLHVSFPMFPEENLYTPPEVEVTLPSGLKNLEKKIPAIVKRYGLTPAQVREILRIIFEE